MDARWIVDRFGRGLLWCTLGAVLALGPGTALADKCNQEPPVGGCEYQLQSPIHYTGLQTRSWAYYCSSGTFFEIGQAAWVLIDTPTNTFTVTENIVAETGNNNFDASITNWTLVDHDFEIQICCCNFNPNN